MRAKAESTEPSIPLNQPIPKFTLQAGVHPNQLRLWGLPEPRLAETKDFIARVGEFSDVVLKTLREARLCKPAH
jgi:hypothetical protein